MYLRSEDLRVESRGTKKFKSAYKEVKKAWLHQQMHFYISFAFVNTIGRFRVGFGVGHIYNMIEHTFLAKILIQIQIFEL